MTTQYIIQDTDTTTKYFVLRAKGIANGRGSYVAEGEEVELGYCLVRGMTDNGQPAWATSPGGSLISFDTYEEAAKTLERIQGARGWDFEMVKDSGVVRERIERHMTYVTEYE